MPLNFKKITTEDAIRNVEDRIAFHKRSIAFTRGLSKSGNKKELLEWLHQAAAVFQKAANDCLGNPNHVRLLRAVSFAGELRGIRKVIDLFENPDTICAPDQQQMEIWANQLKELRDLPTRKNDK